MRARIFSVVSFIASSVLLLALGGKWLMPDQPRAFAWNAPVPTWATADAENMELVGHIGGRTYSVAVQGNYAYIGEGPKLTILDISDPTSPVVIGKTALLPDVVLDVAVIGDYAYVVVGGAGLRVVDISSPSNPTEVGFYNTPGQAEDVAVNGSYAYVADGDDGGLRVVDVSMPSGPTEAGFYDTPGDALGVTVDGNYAYVADGDDGGLRVVDISTPSNPTEAGFYDTPGGAKGVTVEGSYAYIADSHYSNGGLRVVDVSTPTNPTEVGFCDTPEFAEDVAVVEGYAYVVGGNAGLWVVDVLTPTEPVEVGYHSTSGDTGDVVVVAGAPQGHTYAYVAEDEAGLRVVDVSIPSNPTEAGFHAALCPATGVAVAGDYAYVTTGAGLYVIDVSTPSSPAEVGFGRVSGGRLALAGDYAYVTDGYEGLRVVDISTPTDPTEVGFCGTPVIAQDVAVAEDYVYVADHHYGLRVIDVSTPISPTEVGFCDTPGTAYDVAVAGDYAYVADFGDGLRVIDVSTPISPTEVGYYDVPGQSMGVAVAGDYAYVASLVPGLRVIDVSTPFSPTEVGYYDMPGYARDVAVAGDYAYVVRDDVWVADISSPSHPTEAGYYDIPEPAYNVAAAGDYAYVADQEAGLFILRYAETEPVPTPTPTPSTDLGEAVDNTSLDWFTGGDADWFDQTSVYYYDGDAAQSGYLNPNQRSSWIQTTVTGFGRVQFYWRVSSLSGRGNLHFYIDGVRKAGCYAYEDWEPESHLIPSGTHTLRWVYDSWAGRGFLDKVVFTALYPVFLPMVVKNVGSPAMPVLYDISNPDGHYNYTVRWSAADRATSYILEEDEDAAFSSPTVVYSGEDTSKYMFGQNIGTYYYRVRASNQYGDSDWSEIKATTVTEPPPPCPQTGSWSGSTGQGYDVVMTVADTPDCHVDYLEITYRYICIKSGIQTTYVQEIGKYMDTPISYNHFELYDSSRLEVTGDFTSGISASGSCGVSSFYDPVKGQCFGGHSSWTATYSP